MTLYREALELDLGFDLAGLLRTFADHENEHVERLRALGAGSAEPLRFAYGLETRDECCSSRPRSRTPWWGRTSAPSRPRLRRRSVRCWPASCHTRGPAGVDAADARRRDRSAGRLRRGAQPDRAARPRPTLHRHMKASDRGVVALFSATMLTSAILLFSVQPMVARFVLPTFGSAPQVWAVALVFFQAVLLLGYLYAHLSSSRLGVRRALTLHAVLLVAPILTLPLGRPGRERRHGGRQPGLGAARAADGVGRAAVLRRLLDRAAAAALARPHRPSGRQGPVLPLPGEQLRAACSGSSPTRCCSSRG